MSHELELEMTNLWSLVHSTASGCISIGMWEIIKEFHIGAGATWAVFLTASFTLIHAVHRHRRDVVKSLYSRAQDEQNSLAPIDSDDGTGTVTLEP